MRDNSAIHDTVERLLTALEESGKRRTAQRVAICRALAEHPGHPTVGDVFTRVRRDFPMISQATVYNTFDTLQHLGLLTQLDIADHDHTHYDLDITPHINIVCRYCENIVDLHMDTVSSLIQEAASRTGFELQEQAGLILYGACPNCQRRRATSTEGANTLSSARAPSRRNTMGINSQTEARNR